MAERPPRNRARPSAGTWSEWLDRRQREAEAGLAEARRRLDRSETARSLAGEAGLEVGKRLGVARGAVLAVEDAAHGLLFVSSGYEFGRPRPVMAVRPGASGDISLKPDQTANDFIVWSARTGAPYNPTPLVYGDYYYTLFDRGFITSQDARTGKEIYGRQRITADASGFTASPWGYNGKIFAMSEDGDTYVMRAGTTFEVIGKNSLNEMTLATPAVAHGSLLVRTASKLYRISKKAQ